MARHLETYQHNDRIGVLLMIDVPDSFTSRTREFKEFAKNIAMHIAACDPGKNPNESKEYALLGQNYFKDNTKTVLGYISEVEALLQARLRIIKYVRFSTDET